jgi:hypothetical protein
LRDVFDQAQQAALHVFKVVSQQLIQILVELKLHGYHEPLHVHLE